MFSKRLGRFVFLTTGLVLMVIVCAGATCGPAALTQQLGSSSNADTNNNSDTVKVRMRADYGDGTASKIKRAAKAVCSSAPASTDGPHLEAGSDCDNDGGVVAYVTPSTFKVAFKWLGFNRQSDGAVIDVIADTGTLAKSVVVDLASPVTLADMTVPPGYYPNYLAEIYYFELTMPLYDPLSPQTLRVYVSDDDFPAEGNLGHHQGDITLIDSGGVELGFVGDAELWTSALVHADRGFIFGAGDSDLESGHLRGLYGDMALWDQAEFAQGPQQDIFHVLGPLDLLVEKGGKTVTFSFDVKDAWYFEDFDANGRFNPCEANDGCLAGAEWSPIFNKPAASVEATAASQPSS